MNRIKDLTDQRFGRLVAKYPLEERKKRKVMWRCECTCGNEIDVAATYLSNGDTKSCGCLKKDLEKENLRNKFDEKRVEGVAMQLFKDKQPRKDSSSGYRGVVKTVNGTYYAWITVNGKRYYSKTYKTAKEAYYYGRKGLEKEYLPKSY